MVGGPPYFLLLMFLIGPSCHSLSLAQPMFWINEVYNNFYSFNDTFIEIYDGGLGNVTLSNIDLELERPNKRFVAVSLNGMITDKEGFVVLSLNNANQAIRNILEKIQNETVNLKLTMIDKSNQTQIIDIFKKEKGWSDVISCFRNESAVNAIVLVGSKPSKGKINDCPLSPVRLDLVMFRTPFNITVQLISHSIENFPLTNHVFNLFKNDTLVKVFPLEKYSTKNGKVNVTLDISQTFDVNSTYNINLEIIVLSELSVILESLYFGAEPVLAVNLSHSFETYPDKNPAQWVSPVYLQLVPSQSPNFASCYCEVSTSTYNPFVSISNSASRTKKCQEKCNDLILMPPPVTSIMLPKYGAYTYQSEDPVSLPAASASATSLPAASASATSLPATSASATSLPAASASATSLPATSESATSLPATSESATSLPATSESATSLPATSASATSLPATSESATSLPAVPASATSLPATSESATSLPATSESTTSLPATSASATSLPAVPAASASATSLPATSASATSLSATSASATSASATSFSASPSIFFTSLSGASTSSSEDSTSLSEGSTTLSAPTESLSEDSTSSEVSASETSPTSASPSATKMSDTTVPITDDDTTTIPSAAYSLVTSTTVVKNSSHEVDYSTGSSSTIARTTEPSTILASTREKTDSPTDLWKYTVFTDHSEITSNKPATSTSTITANTQRPRLTLYINEIKFGLHSYMENWIELRGEQSLQSVSSYALIHYNTSNGKPAMCLLNSLSRTTDKHSLLYINYKTPGAALFLHDLNSNAGLLKLVYIHANKSQELIDCLAYQMEGTVLNTELVTKCTLHKVKQITQREYHRNWTIGRCNSKFEVLESSPNKINRCPSRRFSHQIYMKILKTSLSTNFETRFLASLVQKLSDDIGCMLSTAFFLDFIANTSEADINIHAYLAAPDQTKLNALFMCYKTLFNKKPVKLRIGSDMVSVYRCYNSSFILPTTNKAPVVISGMKKTLAIVIPLVVFFVFLIGGIIIYMRQKRKTLLSVLGIARYDADQDDLLVNMEDVGRLDTNFQNPTYSQLSVY